MPPANSRNPIFAIFLGVPGVVLWLGGLWICYAATVASILDGIGWEGYSSNQRTRLIVFLSVSSIAPFIGYTMIVFASILSGFERYRLPPKQAIALAALDAGQQFLVLLALCQVILTIGPPPVYDLLSPPVLISSGILFLLFLLLRRFAKRKHHHWRKLSSEPSTF
jgi:hypothetical protein